MRAFAALTAVLAGTACSDIGSYVWVNDLPPSPPKNAVPDDRLSPGDLITIRVFANDNLTTRGRVRSDGGFAFPMVGDIQLGGKRPVEVARDLEARLRNFIVSPAV